MSARISKMYKDSGGCKVGKTCGECRYYANSGIKNEYVCKRQVSDDLWDGKWPACKFFEDRGNEPMELIKKDEITIDLEFSKLIKPLTDEEYKQLEENCVKYGIQDTIKTWNNTIIDGHNRYEISKKHNLSYKTEPMTFADRDEAKQWIILNQFGRRNLSAYDRSLLALQLKPIVSEKAKEKQIRKPADSVPKKSWEQKESTKEEKKAQRKEQRKSETNHIIAKAAGVSEDTIRKVEVIEKKATPKTKELLRSNQISINQAYNSVHPKKPKVDIVAEAKKEHEEFQQKKAEQKVSFQEAKADKNNQKIINMRLLEDVLKLCKAIDTFGLTHNKSELPNLREVVSDSERSMIKFQCAQCREVLSIIEENL